MTITCDRCGIDVTLDSAIVDPSEFRVGRYEPVRRRYVTYPETVCQCGAVIRTYPLVGGNYNHVIVRVEQPEPEASYEHDREYY